MNVAELEATAQALVSSGRGILAADESAGTMQKRLAGVDVESTEDNRRDYREMLLRTRDLGDYVSGIILYDETIRQDAADVRRWSRSSSRRASFRASRWTRAPSPCPRRRARR